MLGDAKRFVLSNVALIEEAPLQVYYSALVFSPSKSIVRGLFQAQIPDWIDLQPKVPETWDSLLQTLEGHSGWVYSVAFSPDGQKIVSGSWDQTVRVWDAAAGTLLQTLEGHSHSVHSVLSVATSLDDSSKRLSVKYFWIMVDEKKAIWLPPNRRAQELASFKNKIAIKSSSGIVTIIRFNLDKFD